MSNVSRHMNALSLPEIENLRALVLENATELLDEAKLLFEHERYARACALSHLSSEELAKLPMLAGVGVRICRGLEVNWPKFHKKFSSHAAKLKILLSVDLLGTKIDPTTKDIRVHKEVKSRIDLFNDLKNATLYAGVNQDSFYKPSALFTRAYATQALALAANRFELFASVEAHTQGRIAELAGSSAYMKLLETLRIGDDG
jgi:AbiV family abortive infection protein